MARGLRKSRASKKGAAAAGAALLCATAGLVVRRSTCFWLPGRPLHADGAGAARAHMAAAAENDAAASRRGLLLGSGLAAAGAAGAAPAEAISGEERRVAQMFLDRSPSVTGIVDMSSTKLARLAKNPGTVGSGFVWDGTHVVTNYHVIEELTNPHVSFLTTSETGQQEHVAFGAAIVGADPLSDIAVLEVQGEDAELAEFMQPLPRGASRALRPGQEVFALGNPFGLERSMSRGIISGVSRTFQGVLGRPMAGIIQTDASINPGNSGGPLLNSDGSVIGVNAAILSTSDTFSGVGLAIPIDTVEHNVASMIDLGYVNRPSLGVVLAPPYVSEALGVESGAMVMKVFKGSAAQKAGVQALRKGRLGDVITRLGGTPVSSASEVFEILEDKIPGEDIVMQVRRAAEVDGEGYNYLDVKVRLGSSNSKVVSV